MVGTVLIRGDGIAACCCARALGAGNVSVSIAKTGGLRPGWILLSESTQALLTDLFEDPDLFRDMPSIGKRVVQWGTEGEPLVLPHSAVVASEQVLLANLWERLRQRLELPVVQTHEAAEWEIQSSQAIHPAGEVLNFGSQIASSSNAQLKRDADPETCWVESMSDGWLFLFTSGEGRAHMISVGECVEGLLSRSRLVASKIDSLSVSSRNLPAHPRILSNLCGTGWLACGSSAMGFDPLCGEGAGNAVREAILASAVLRGIANGFDAQSLLAHYRARLTQGFLRHLLTCQRFYLTAGPGAFWENELRLLHNGIKWSQRQLSAAPAPGYRLVGFDLVPI